MTKLNSAIAHCPVKPLDVVEFTPLNRTQPITGTVFQCLDTSGGNWRVRIVRSGESFPHGNSVNVYTHEGTFHVLGTLCPDAVPAVA